MEDALGSSCVHPGSQVLVRNHLSDLGVGAFRGCRDSVSSVVPLLLWRPHPVLGDMSVGSSTKQMVR